MRISCIILSICLIQCAYANEHVLNEAALHTNARGFALGGLLCDYEPSTTTEMELTYLIPFQLNELSIRKVAFSKNIFALGWKFNWYQSGNSDWMENNLRLHVGKKLSEALYLGVDVCLLLLDNVEEGAVSTCFAELDGQYRLSEKVGMSFLITNPSSAYFKSAGELIPLSISAHFGVQYTPVSKSRIYLEMAGQLRQAAQGHLGVEYKLLDAFILRTGFSTSPWMPSWGIGGAVSQFHYSWGGNLHPILGFSNGFTLTYRW